MTKASYVKILIDNIENRRIEIKKLTLKNNMEANLITALNKLKK
jgi:hypothetical protein